ncbi:hypothetical protein CPter291_2641 [Collimonas pratensis]|uniref:Uncharacterized protein n=1 Tax=Collimonas pratensis TaxID=279113 RepID=A0ABM5Z7Q8_9BURK|nr:hypothetical protein CPter291_2641 [Collimonas pratensis]
MATEQDRVAAQYGRGANGSSNKFTSGEALAFGVCCCIFVSFLTHGNFLS